MHLLNKKLDHREVGGAAERREADRRSVHREGWLRAADGTIHGVVVLDVSAGGAGITMLVAHMLEIDDAVELSIDMESPGSEAWLQCVVKWRVRERLGLAFCSSKASTSSTVLTRRRRRDE